MGVVIFLAAAAAANVAPVVDAASVSGTTVALVAAVPLSADPTLASVKLRRPVVHFDAPAFAISPAMRDYAIRTVPVERRAADFMPHAGSDAAEPAWSRTLASMEMGRSKPRKVGRGPLGGVFAFRVTDQHSEPSVGGIAGALIKITDSSR